MTLSFTRISATLLGIEALLLALTAVSVLRLTEAKAAFHDSIDNAEECRRLVSEIEALQAMEAIATEDQQTEELSNAATIRIALESGLSESQVTAIQRQAPAVVDGTEYERHDVSVILKDATLPQILAFALAVEQEFDAVTTTAINLSSPQSINQRYLSVKPPTESAGNSAADVPSETWNAELILTQLVYVATSSPR